MRIIQQRTRFFLAVEGDSERSFTTWLQRLADERELHIHLDSNVIDGGGYSTMLANSVRLLKKGSSRPYSGGKFMLIDSDRADNGDDGWSIEQLRKEADKYKITVCLQKPNIEGVFFRMLPDKEQAFPDSQSSQRKLKDIWKHYEKPANFQEISRQFCINDLLRMAKHDNDIKHLLEKIGLLNPQRKQMNDALLPEIRQT